MPKGFPILPRTWRPRPCDGCKKYFIPSGRARYCSYECARSINGYNDEEYIAWQKMQNGYWVCTVTHAGARVRVLRHRWEWEKNFGGLLAPNEAVHHLDGDKDNNDIENLGLMSQGEHTTLHNNERIYNKGYKLNVSEEDRRGRAERLVAWKVRNGKQ